jgi:hypothetical protein
MLSASYNLPSEDWNTQKQMVFYCNKLLCVYSLQSWLSETFTFNSKLTRCQTRGRRSPSRKGLPAQGELQPDPRGPVVVKVKVKSFGGGGGHVARL